MRALVFCVISSIYFNGYNSVYGVETTSGPSATSNEQFTVPKPAIIFLGFLGVCLLVVFILYKILHSDICKLDRNKLAGVSQAEYAELGQSAALEDESLDESDSVDFIERETTASDRSDDHPVHKPAPYVKSRSLGDLFAEKPRQPPAPQRKLTQWERPSIEAVKAASHLNVLSAYGDTGGGQRVRRKSRKESRGDLTCIAKIQVSVAFAQTAQRLEVTIIRVQDFPEAISVNSATSSMSIHLTLMPSKRYRFKTKTKSTSDVTINETFVMRGVSANELMDSSLRFRIYAQGSMKTGRLLGETETHVTDFDLDDMVSTMWIMVPPAEEHKKSSSKQRK